MYNNIFRSNHNNEKYNKINSELSKYSDDDLASVLFVRFKNSENFLLKEALIIHRSLIDPMNYNIKPYEKKPYEMIKKNKSKYNNKTKKV